MWNLSWQCQYIWHHYHSTVREINRISIRLSHSITCLLSSSFLKLNWFSIPIPFILQCKLNQKYFQFSYPNIRPFNGAVLSHTFPRLMDLKRTILPTILLGGGRGEGTQKKTHKRAFLLAKAMFGGKSTHTESEQYRMELGKAAR